MPDPIPGCDPSEAYEVVPLDPIRKDRALATLESWVLLRGSTVKEVLRITADRAEAAQ
jgi:hypothetical protein